MKIDFRKVKKEHNLKLDVCDDCGGIGLTDFTEDRNVCLSCNQCGKILKVFK